MRLLYRVRGPVLTGFTALGLRGGTARWDDIYETAHLMTARKSSNERSQVQGHAQL